eukprot:1643380-Pleurochrysis_carterae.AAC.2
MSVTSDLVPCSKPGDQGAVRQLRSILADLLRASCGHAGCVAAVIRCRHDRTRDHKLCTFARLDQAVRITWSGVGGAGFGALGRPLVRQPEPSATPPQRPSCCVELPNRVHPKSLNGSSVIPVHPCLPALALPSLDSAQFVLRKRLYQIVLDRF